MNKKITNVKIPDNNRKLVENNIKYDNYSKKLTYDSIAFENYDVSFQFYKIGNHKKKLKELKKEELKELDKLITHIVKCTKENELLSVHRGKTNNSKSKKKKLSFKELELEDNEIVHLGYDKSKFRLHGVFLGKSFKVLCIDPEHKVHEV